MQDPQLEQRMRDYLDRELCQAAGIQCKPEMASPEAAANVISPAPEAREVDIDLLHAEITELTGQALGIPLDQLDLDENLANYGMDSIAITEVMAQISRKLDISIAPTTFYEAKNLQELCDILQERYPKVMLKRYPVKASVEQVRETQRPEFQSTPVKAEPATTPQNNTGEAPTNALSRAHVGDWLNQYRTMLKSQKLPLKETAKPPGTVTQPYSATVPEQQTVAVISMAGKFPGCPDVASFAEALEQGRDCISEVLSDRWDWRSVYGNPKKGPYTDVKYGGFVDDIAAFDADFFNISRKEAELTDPQHRLFIQTVWQLIESGGYAPKSLAGRNVSIFLGINLQDYAHLVAESGSIEPVQLAGLGHMFCPNRLSFLLDVQGPSQVIDTACSSSLAAIHRGVMSILHEGCEMAIAGGSNLLMTPLQHILFSRVGMICPDGRCKTFSSDANGYVRSDGVAAVLLKRLDLAERDGDHILGVIRSSGENHGGTATSLTAPNQAAQANLIAEVQRKGNIDPRTISLIECHGTGTPLGDPIEIEGLKQAFERRYRELDLTPPTSAYCGLGSVKSNIGHTETAAGVTGLIKLLCAMQSQKQYRSLHCDNLNANIDLKDSPFYILQQQRSWQRPTVDGVEVPRRAALSSFGAGGANVHLILEEYQSPAASTEKPSGPYVFPLSAKKPHLLRQYAAKLANDVRQNQPHLADLAYTLQTGRDPYKCRFACVAENTTQLLKNLDCFAAEQPGDYHYRQLHKRDLQAKTVAASQNGASAEAWVNGATLDWQALYDTTQVRRIPTATYPFEATHHWLPSKTPNQRPTITPSLEALSPGRYRVVLQEIAFYHDHHRVNQKATTPGVMHVDLMLQAAKAANIHAVGVRQLLWLKPIQFEKNQTIELKLQNGPTPHVEIVSDDQIHSRATLLTSSGSMPATQTRPDFDASLWQHINHERIYSAFEAIGLNYGPGHRGVKQIFRNKQAGDFREVWAQLQLPPAVEHTRDAFHLHPSLLDGALQAAIGLVLEPSGPLPEETALPFAVDHIEKYADLPTEVWVHISQPSHSAGQTTKSTLTLYNNEGVPCLGIKGFTTRRMAAPNTSSQDQAMLYQPTWQTLAPKPLAPKKGTCQLFTVNLDDQNIASQLPEYQIQNLRVQGQNPAAQFHNLYTQLFEACKSLLTANQINGIQVLIANAEIGQASYGISGLLRTISNEYPKLRCQLILSEGQLATLDLATTLRTAAQHSASCLRIQNNRLQVESAHVLQQNKQSTPPWRDGGVYLITGGLGALGKLFARDIANKTQGSTLLLLGRSPAHADNQHFLQSLERKGAQVHYQQIDLADEDALTYALEDLQARHGHIHIALHTAGVLRDDFLRNKTLEQWQQVSQAKVWGTHYLAQQLQNLNCEHLLLFSSLSSWFGNPGQADYAAANGFMDAVAQQWQGEMRVQAINWPLWQNGNMQMDAATQSAMQRKTGFTPLPDQVGLQFAYDAIRNESRQLIALYGDAEKITTLFDPKKSATVANASMATEVAQKSTVQNDHAALKRALQRNLVQQVAELLKVEAEIIEIEEELTEYGFDSITFTEFTNALNEHFDLDFMPTVFFQYPTIESFSAHVVEEHAEAIGQALCLDIQSVPASPQEPTSTVEPNPVAFTQTPPNNQTLIDPQTKPSQDKNAIAIIGMAGLFPKAENLKQFWHNLDTGRDCIDQPADWRFSEEERAWIGSAGFVAGIADFDPAFFGISPAEAKMMDPQQRLLLRLAFQALEDAGYSSKSFAASDLGIFVGTADTGYSHLLDRAQTQVEAYFGTALAPSLGPNRMSYWLDAHGPSEAVETACSSALVAIHRAVTAMRSGQCNSALVGGINTLLIPETFASFAKAGMTGSGHRCRTFSANADGYVRGEGAGVVLLKPLADAQRDKDHIYAVIRGSAVNHGGRASSLTAPNPKAQAQLLRKAYADANIDPSTIGYIETHGTGTPLGDPIEVEALKEVFSAAGSQPNSIGLGSVKSNIGHLEIASGMAGLLKLVLQMQHRKLVESLHAKPFNSMLKLEKSPFYVVTENRVWHPTPNLPLRAGVSSFGFGGTNAHVVLEAYDNANHAQTSTKAFPILISAKSDRCLQRRVNDLLAHINDHPELNLSDIAFTLAVGRDAMSHRLAFTCKSRASLLQTLQALAQSRKTNHVFQGDNQAHREALAPLRQDADFNRLALSWLHNGKADKTLELWTRGLDLNWQSVFDDLETRRIPLPTYSFDFKRYWPDQQANSDREPQIKAPQKITLGATQNLNASSQKSQESITTASEPASQRAAAYDLLAEIAAATLEMNAADFDPHINLADYGFDSITLVGFTDRINDRINLELSPADLFDFPTLEQLADGLREQHPLAFDRVSPSKPQIPTTTAVEMPRLPEVKAQENSHGDTLLCAHTAWYPQTFTPQGTTKQRHTLLLGVKAETAQLPGTYEHHHLSVANTATTYANMASLLLKTLQDPTLTHLQVVVPANHPAQLEGLVGMLRSAIWERQNLTAQLVCVEPSTDSSALSQQLNHEAQSTAIHVRYVDNQRLLAKLEEIKVSKSTSKLSSESLYLITGGSGGIALKFAQRLRRRAPDANIYAIGRSQPASSVAQQLEQSQVHYQQIDLLDAPALNDFIAQLHCEHGIIDGLIHCAGVIEDAPISEKSAISLHRVLEPKVTGLQNLLDACNGSDPNHLILCSSLTAVFGNPGQADYAAANGYLTAIAEYRNQQGKTSSVIHWPLWQDGGMRPDAAKVDQIQRTTGLVPLPDQQGLEIFDAILHQPTSEVAVFYGDGPTLRNKLLQTEPVAANSQAVQPSSSQNHRERTAEAHATEVKNDVISPKAQPQEDDAIAIVGISASFPGAPDLDAFWQNLQDGKHSIREIPTDRWDWRALYGDPKTEPNRSNVKWAGFIDGLHQFDPLHFGISPSEAAAMDPQQRLLLTYVWRALENAGHAPQSLAGSKTGVFMAITGTSLLDKRNQQVDDYSATGSVSSIGANRISYLLDLHGPSEPVETACSSTLVALHRAAAAIRSGECSQALVGGVNLLTAPEVHISFNKAGMLSQDGRCKTFSAEADGYVRGEGVGVVFLRKLCDAERDGNRILAIVKATHVNHGGRAHSLTAPNADAQAALLRETYSKAGMDPQSISYIEAHGTGTALGDPIEINALKRVFGASSEPHIGLGSVKTNIGHLELAAGLAGLAKVLLQMQHGKLVPTLFSSPRNPHINLENSPFYLVEQTQNWAPAANTPLRAGVSSFGFGGVNAHVVLEQYQAKGQPAAASPSPLLWVFAAKDANGLKRVAQQFISYLDTHPDSNLTNLTYTLQVGRDPHRTRLAFAASTQTEARNTLQAFLAGQPANYDTSPEHSNTETRYSDTSNLLTAYRQDGSYEQLLRQWCHGATVDWSALYPEQKPQRIELPTYPFDMMDMRTIGKINKPTPPTNDPHKVTVTAEGSFVRDHIVAGNTIVAGAFTVERARAAAPQSSLQQIVWRHPVQVNDKAVSLHTQITDKDGDPHIQITNPETGTIHLEAKASSTPIPSPDPLDLNNLKTQLTHWQESDIASTYAGFALAGIQYGPSHRVLSKLYYKGEQVWAQLQLPQANHASIKDYQLHPSMLDGAFQACAALLQQDASKQLLIPYAIDQLQSYRSCSAEMWVHLQRTHHKPDLQRWNIELYRHDGQPVACIKDFTLRPLRKPQGRGSLKTTQQPEQHQVAVEFFSDLFAEVSSVPRHRFTPQTQLEDLGFDSMMVTRMTDRLERIFGKLSRTLMFEFRNIAEMSAHFEQHHANILAQQLRPNATASTSNEPIPIASAPDSAPATPSAKPAPEDAIAIVGLAGRYPQADNLDAFWRNLLAGRDCVSEVPLERWNHQKFYHPDKGIPGKTYSKWGGFIDRFDHFDPLFFNISPREAAYMDPQERLFLQCAWSAIEDAGHTRTSLGTQVGVFVGVMYSEYQLHGVAQTAAGGPDLALPGHPASIANRLSYFGNFQGPSMALDTMCSSSLTAIHLAINSMRNGECRAAIAGGVNLNLHPNKFLTLAQGRFASSHGRCASFGEGGDGYVPSEGVGAVILKPLSAAQVDGDHVYGIIRASALNHGGKTNGYSVPDPNAQAAVIRDALQRAQVDPSAVSYIEAHGTGTALGDPIEISGLSKAFANNASPCAIGSVKSNIGHGESVAGMAGLSKILLQLKHRQLVPSLHATPSNRDIDFSQTPFRLQHQQQNWHPQTGQNTRIAGLSSFGAGGANAHLIIEEHAHTLPSIAIEAPLIFPISARNTESLQHMAQQLSDHLKQIPDTHLAHVAFTLQQGREAFEERALVIASSCTELQAGLSQIAASATQYVAPANIPAQTQQLAQQFLASTTPDWQQTYAADQHLRRISLPTYVFNESRYWAPTNKPEGSTPSLPLLLQAQWQPAQPATRAQHACHVIAIELRCDTANWTHLCHPSKEIESRYEFYATRLLEELKQLASKPQIQRLQVLLPDHCEAQPLTGLAGLLRTATQEHANLHINLLEIPNQQDALALANQYQPQATFQHIAWRADQAVTKHYEPYTPQHSSKPWQDGGVYLISGGAGGLGLLFAREIAANAKNTTLILVGRSPMTVDRWTKLERIPAKVHYQPFDVADADATQTALEEIANTHGKLNGIIHAAGITRDALIRDKDTVSLMRVLAPKISGLLNLERASRGHNLDFILLCSSVSGAFGNVGQADYATANAFMDAFAQSYQGKARCLSINWPYWREGGMQIAPEQLKHLAEHYGIQPLEREPGFAALYAAYASDQQQMIVMSGDRQRLLQQIQPKQAHTNEPSIAEAETPTHTPDQQALNDYLRQTVAQVLQMAPEKLADHSDFDRYGMDSVMTLEVVDALAKRFGSLPNSLLLDCTNLAELQAWLLQNKRERINSEFASTTIESDHSNATSQEAFPLTASQEALWLLQQIYPELYAYHLPMAFTINDLQLKALQQTIQNVVQQNPHLQTQLHMQDDMPLQRLTTAQNPLEIRFCEDPVQQAQIAAREPFTLGNSPLVRFQLFRNSCDVLLITAHHLLLDGRSMALLAEAVVSEYQHLSANPNAITQLPHSPATFQQFASQETTYLSSDQAQADLQFWREQLHGSRASISLPGSSNSNLRDPFASEVIEQTLDLNLRDQLQAQCSDWRIKPAALYLGCFQLLLHGYSGQNDLVIGVPHLGRNSSDERRALGYYAGMIPLRQQLNRNIAPQDFFHAVQAKLQDSLAHSAYPLPALMRDLHRGKGSTPLFELTFSFQNFVRQTTSTVSGFQLVPQVRQKGDHPFGMEIYPEADGMRIALLYHPERYNPDLVKDMLGKYCELLQQVAQQPATLADLQLTRQPAPAKAQSDPTLLPVHRRIAAQASLTPNATALICEDHSLSYSQLQQRVDRLAAAIAQQVEVQHRPVAVMLERSADSIIAMLAIWRLGGIYLPLDHKAPSERNQRILDHSQAALLLSRTPLTSSVQQFDWPTQLPLSVPPQVAVVLHDNAYIIYTSGSTGEPKGVVIQHHALADHSVQAAIAYQLSPQDTVLQFTGLHLDASLEQILPILTVGGRLLLRGEDLWNATTFGERCGQYQVTIADLPPLYLADLLSAWDKQTARPPTAPRMVIVGGEALPNATIAAFQHSPFQQARLINAYGPTETVITTTIADVAQHNTAAPVPIGNPLPKRHCYILDDWLRPVPDQVIGELYIGGLLASGYLNAPQQTAATFLPDPFNSAPGARMYRSGDRAYLHNQQLHFCGRIDRQVQLRGYRVELGEIEQAIASHEHIQQAVVQLETQPQRLIAWYLDPSESVTPQRLRASLQHQLPSHMQPAQLVPVTKMPMNSAGKVDLTALPVPALASDPAKQPTTAIERKLAQLWCDILGITTPDTEQDFFSLGGHSLHLLKLADAIHSQFQIKLPLDQLLSHHTIATQALLITDPDHNPSDLRLLREGSGTALYIFPAIGGNLVPYSDLIRDLTFTGPIYGLGDHPSDHPDITEMAQTFAQTIQRQQQGQPLICLGWSMGGLLAIATAQHLVKLGNPPQRTLLIESYTPSALAEIDRHLFGQLPKQRYARAAFAWDRLGNTSFKIDDEPIEAFCNRLSKQLPQALDPGELQRDFTRYCAYFQAIQAHTPVTCALPVSLLIARDVSYHDPTRGWAHLLPNLAPPVSLPGDHDSILRQNAAAISEQLSHTSTPKTK